MEAYKNTILYEIVISEDERSNISKQSYLFLNRSALALDWWEDKPNYAGECHNITENTIVVKIYSKIREERVTVISFSDQLKMRKERNFHGAWIIQVGWKRQRFERRKRSRRILGSRF